MPLFTNSVKSVQVTKLDASPAVKLQPNEKDYGEYEASALTAESVIKMIRVPSGSRIRGGKCKWDALGSGTALTVGDQYDTDRFMSLKYGVAASTGSETFDGVDGLGAYVYSCEQDINVYVTGASTGTITLTLDVARN